MNGSEKIERLKNSIWFLV